MKFTISLVIFLTLIFGAKAQSSDSLAIIHEVDSLIKLNRSLIDKRQYNEALIAIEVAKAKAESAFGKNNAIYADCVFNHGRTYFFTNKFSESESLLLEAKIIRENVVGKENPDYAQNLLNLGYIYYKTGQYEKSESFYLEALAIREKVLGKANTDYASSLSNLGVLYEAMGRFDDAEPLYLESKAIIENILGKEHRDYALKLEKLANLYRELGRYEKAETLYLEVKAIREKKLGKEHPDYASILNNLAVLYGSMKLYEKVETLILESIAIQKITLGKEHPDYAATLLQLANLDRNMGRYEQAEPLYLEIKAIMEKVIGKEHPDYAIILLNIGSLYKITERYEQAEPLYLEAKAIIEKSIGKDHPMYSTVLLHLATLYINMDLGNTAEPLLLESKKNIEETIGKNSPIYTSIIKSIAVLYFDMGRYAEAESLYLETKNILKTDSIQEYSYDEFLAALYNITGQFENIENFSFEMLQTEWAKLYKASLYLSENELASYANTFSYDYNVFFSIFSSRFSKSQKIASALFDNTIFYKGFILNTVQQLKRSIAIDSTAREMSESLASYHRRLAKQYALPTVSQDSSIVSELEAKANYLEKELIRSIASSGFSPQQISWQDVQRHLQPNEAAIEFVHFQYYNDQIEATDSTMYTALLILPESVSPVCIPLFEEHELDSLLHYSGGEQSVYFNDVYALLSRGLTPVEKKKISEKLYSLIWSPIQAELHNKGINRIYYSPSGKLHNLNFDAIPLSRDSTLSDRYQLVRVISTRELVMPIHQQGDNNNATLFGGIQYDLDTSSISILDNSGNENSYISSRGELAFSMADSILHMGSWEFLPFTQKEVRSVDKILENAGINTQVLLGHNATEEAFKEMGSSVSPSPRIIHIATHGYFFPDPKKQKISLLNDGSLTNFKISEHPMIRSGLILAGGNNAWQNKPNNGNREDGIITAYEISNMNLQNTELVILSACETGLGEIKGNEGVYGLQRAFKIAGVKNLIMSLWQVPDKETANLMTVFYKNWLEGKMTISNALRAAQKEMRERGLAPYFWAGFVLVE